MTDEADLSMGPEIVAIPGPSVTPPRVLAAMHRSMPDIYAGELIEISDEVFDLLPVLARTTTATPFVTISNGHGTWDMVLTNTMSRGDRLLALNCGRFGSLWAEKAEFLGVDVTLIESAPRRADDPARVHEALAADPGHTISAVTMTHVDTASSLRSDVAAVRRAIDEAGHPALLMVDCIASMGCEPFEMDGWGVDVVVAASQKGLMCPPGLGFVWAGERAMDVHRRAGLRTAYWDWTARSSGGPHYLRYSGTPPVAHLFGIREALRMVFDEGLEARWERHRVLADAVRAAVDAWSTPGAIELHGIDASERSNAVTSILAGSVDPEALRAAAAELGVTLGLGLGAMGDQSFRIGHMGYVSAPMVLGVIGVVDAALARIGAPVGGSGAAAAAAVIADAG